MKARATDHRCISTSIDGCSGGALFVLGALTLERCVVRNATAYNGGAVLLTSGSAILTVIDSLFVNNSASYGGAIQLLNKDATLSCTSTDFVTNTAEQGGAVRLQGYEGQPGPLTEFYDCRFQANMATNKGSAMMLKYGSANLTRCRVTDNGEDERVYDGSFSTTATRSVLSSVRSHIATEQPITPPPATTTS